MDAPGPTNTLDEAAEDSRRALALTVIADILTRRGFPFDCGLSAATPQPVPPTKPRPAWLRGIVAGRRFG